MTSSSWLLPTLFDFDEWHSLHLVSIRDALDKTLDGETGQKA